MASDSQQPRVERLVIGIAGRIGAGKTSAGTYLHSRHGFQYLRYSQVLAEWLAKDPESKADLQDIGWDVMAKGRQGELNRRLITQIKPDSDAVVDGLRHPLDYESLKNSFGPSFHLLYIESDRAKRWDRKKTKDKYRTLASFETADSHPVEQQIDSLRGRAFAIVQNQDSLTSLYFKVDALLNAIRSGRST